MSQTITEVEGDDRRGVVICYYPYSGGTGGNGETKAISQESSESVPSMSKMDRKQAWKTGYQSERTNGGAVVAAGGIRRVGKERGYFGPGPDEISGRSLVRFGAAVRTVDAGWVREWVLYRQIL